MFIDKPTLEKPELTMFGDEANIRLLLLRIFKFLKANCAAKDFSQIDTSLCFSYSDYDEFRHDENNLRIFSATFPKVGCDVYFSVCERFGNISQCTSRSIEKIK